MIDEPGTLRVVRVFPEGKPGGVGCPRLERLRSVSGAGPISTKDNWYHNLSDGPNNFH